MISPNSFLNSPDKPVALYAGRTQISVLHVPIISYTLHLGIASRTGVDTGYECSITKGICGLGHIPRSTKNPLYLYLLCLIHFFLFCYYRKNGKGRPKTVSKTVIIASGTVLIVFAVGGTELTIFRITKFSFMIAGVLLYIVAIELLTHGVWRFGGGKLPEDSRVVFLDFPLLAGPGSITSVIISYETSGLIVTILSIAIVIGIMYFILLFINSIYRLLGRRGSMILTRVAVFIAAIAAQYVVEGAKRLFI